MIDAAHKDAAKITEIFEEQRQRNMVHTQTQQQYKYLFGDISMC